MHDEELTRTTNVQAVFPERAALNSTAFNWTDLQQLDAGTWFLEVRNVLRVAGEEWMHFWVKHYPCPGAPEPFLVLADTWTGCRSMHKSLGCNYALSWGLF